VDGTCSGSWRVAGSSIILRFLLSILLERWIKGKQVVRMGGGLNWATFLSVSGGFGFTSVGPRVLLPQNELGNC
jgi:hypothetical protein